MLICCYIYFTSILLCVPSYYLACYVITNLIDPLLLSFKLQLIIYILNSNTDKMSTPLKYCRNKDSLRIREWTNEFEHKPFENYTPIARHGSRKIQLVQWLRVCGNFIPERYIMIKIAETLPPA